MLYQQDIVEKIAALRAGHLSLEDFAEWIDGASYNMHSNGSEPAAVDLAESIHLTFSEYDRGHRDRAEVLALISGLVSHVRYIDLRVKAGRVSISAASVLVSQHRALTFS